MVDDNVVKDSPGDRIGSTPHKGRNLLFGAGAVVAIGLVGLFYWSSAKSDASSLDELNGFRKTMASKCKQEQFAKPTSPQLASLYADSSRMQATVRTQIGSLQREPLDCEQIVKSLKSVDFPVE